MSSSSLTVVIPVFNSSKLVQKCLNSLIYSGLDPSIARLHVIDDASTDPNISTILKDFASKDPRIAITQNHVNKGYLRTINSALLECNGPVILLNSDTLVGPNWATRLCEGAAHYPRLGALTPVSNNATFSTLPGYPGSSLDAICEENFKAADAALAQLNHSHYPIAPTGMGFCLYISHLGLKIGEAFDLLFDPGYEEENDFCMRLRSHGLQCRIATNVLVYHYGGASFGARKLTLMREHYELIKKVHPTYDAAITEWFAHADTQSLFLNSLPDRRIRILLDGEILRQSMTGVVRYAATLLDLCSSPSLHHSLETFVVVNDLATASYWSTHYPSIQWVTYDELLSRPSRLNPDFHVYHVFNANISIDRVMALRRLTRRYIFTVHDLIAYENTSYWNSGDEYLAYRQRFRSLALLADQVIAISQATARDLIECLGEQHSIIIFPNPLSYLSLSLSQAESEAESVFSPEPLSSSPKVLVVGTDFKHKNLLQTVLLFESAIFRHYPRASLTIVGPQVATGGSIEKVRHYVNSKKKLSQQVKFLGAISDKQLVNQYKTSALCMYLSIQEGFGYIPYEAARFNCPTLVSNTSVYNEMPEYIAVPPMLCDSSIRIAQDLVSSPKSRNQNISFWKQLIDRDLTRDPARELIDIYQNSLANHRPKSINYIAEVLSMQASQGSSLSAYQLSYKQAIKTLVNRSILGAKRRLRTILRRLTQPNHRHAG